MFQVKVITAKDAAKIIATEEGLFADVKAKEIEPAKLSKTISAFANTSGGDVYLGIAESEIRGKKRRKWAGFKDVEAANAHLQVIEGIGALGNHYRPTFLQREGGRGYVLHLAIFKTTGILKATNGTPYVRRGAQNLPVDTEDKPKG